MKNIVSLASLPSILLGLVLLQGCSQSPFNTQAFKLGAGGQNSGSVVDEADYEAMTRAVANREITGFVDAVTARSDGSVDIAGWACAVKIKQSVPVHFYLGGAAGQGGTYVGETIANLASESAVANSCRTNGGNYRYRFNLSAAVVKQHQEKAVFVHGISPVGLANRLLIWSGRFKIPTLQTSSNNNQKLSALARPGQDLEIPQGVTAEIDTSVDINKLIIRGQLVCPPTGDFTIKTTGILVMGAGSALRCGNPANRFQGTFKIALKGGLFESLHGDKPSDRNFMVMGGGTLELVGQLKNTKWLRLAKNAQAGEMSITLTEAVSWSPGDQLAIAPTGYRFDEGEKVVVQSLADGGRTVILQSPLKYAHWGTLQTYSGRRTWTVDERAEVANLTRNILIYSDGAREQLNFLGGHVMTMGRAFAYVDAVEFFRLGRMGEMARYPFHWHREGNVAGQYIKNSSIHDAFQRCITVHGTQNAVVDNNVCFDHYGHGIFLEDGNETGNSITNNLVMVSRRPLPGRHLLSSDINADSDRFPGPATFWISNPQNTVKGNVAAGSEGTGFWMSFSPAIACDSRRFCQKPDATHPATVFPAGLNTLEFASNTAHSADVGMTWDGVPEGELTNNPNNPMDRKLTIVHYGPAQPPSFRNLAVHKTTKSGVYYRGTTAYFSNLVFADNKVGLFFSYNQVASDSAIIAQTANHVASDYQHNPTFTGINVYDGPFDLRNIDFLNFATQPIYYRDVRRPAGQQDLTIVQTPISYVGGTDRFANVVQGLVFNPEPVRRIDLSHDRPEYTSSLQFILKFIWWTAESDSQSAPGVRDLDGSLTGRANSIVVPNHPFMNHNGCVPIADGRALSCDHQWGGFLFNSIRDGKWFETVPMIITRNDGVASQAAFDQLDFFNIKFGVILGKGFDQYDVHFAPNWTMPGKNAANPNEANSFQINFKSELMNQKSPVLALRGLGQSCFVRSTPNNDWQMMGSLDQLKGATVNSYFSSGGILYVRFISSETAESTAYASQFGKQGRSKYALINCQ